MVVSGGAALLSGAVGASLVAMQTIGLPGDWGLFIPIAKWPAFAFALWAHSASYLMGALGGLFLIAITLQRRLRASTPT